MILELHTTDLKARRKALWGIISCSAYGSLVLALAVYQMATGKSWYWWGMGLAITALFAAGLASHIHDFRKARTHYASVEELLEANRG